MTFVDFKDLPRRTASDEVLCDKGFNIAKNWKYEFINFLMRNLLVVVLTVKLCLTIN